MKRNVIISGEFTMAEVSSASQSTSSKPKKTATERIAALKAAGVDVSCYFPMGEEMIVRVKDGIPSQVTDDDPVFTRIAEGGYIAHSRLFRRWVMAQMFRMLRDMQRDGRDFTAVLQQHGYDYSWKMLEYEFLAQHKMAKHGDSTAFAERNRWFSRDVAVAMAEDYLAHIQRLIPTLREHLCRKRPYKRICGVNVFTNEIDFKFIAPIRRAIDDIRRADNPCRLHKAVASFNRQRHHLRWQTKQAKAFVDAYKGAGAYFTMKNLILFHGARFSQRPSEQQSLRMLDDISRHYEGWELLGAMKQLITGSGISIEKKMSEWAMR